MSRVGVSVFILVFVGSFLLAYGSTGSFRFRWVESVLVAFAGFAWVRLGSLCAPRSFRVLSGSLEFTRVRIGSPGSLGFAWVLLGAHLCRRIYLGSCVFTRAVTRLTQDR